MNRTKALINNSIFAILLQVVTFITGLIGPRLILQTYGSEINGLISSINQFISYFNLVEAGLASASVYALYKPLAEKDEVGINAILSATRRYYNISGYIFVSLVAALAAVYPFFTEISALGVWEVRILVLILGVSGTMQFFVMSKYRALLTADQKQFVISIASIFSVLLNTAMIVVCTSVRMNVVLMRAICLISVFSPLIILTTYLRKHYPFVKFNEKPNNEALQGRWSVLINEIFGTIHFSSPVAILTVIRTLIEVSIYSVYSTVFSGVNKLCSSFTYALSASFGEILALKDSATLEKAYNEYETVFYGFNAFIYSLVLILILPFISIYTSGIKDAQYYRPMIALLFTINETASGLYTPQAVMIRADGLFKEVRRQTILQSMITLVGGVILTWRLGIIGILAASSISNLIRVFLSMRLVSSYIKEIQFYTTLRRIGISLLDMVLITLPFSIGPKPALLPFLAVTPSNYLQWVLYACVAAVYGLAVVLLVARLTDKKAFENVVKRARALIKK